MRGAAYRRVPIRTSHSAYSALAWSFRGQSGRETTSDDWSQIMGWAAICCHAHPRGSAPSRHGQRGASIRRWKNRVKTGLKRYANAHLKFVGHHTLAQRLTEEVLLRYHRRRCQGPITFRHKPTAESCTDIGEQCLLTDLQSATQGRRLSNRILMSVYTSRPLCPRAR